VLTLYQETAGPLSAEQTADGLVVADVLARTLTSIQSRSTSPALAVELTDTNAHRAEVHQASGMLSVQLGIAVDEARARIRAHAYSTNQSSALVAQQIVSRTLRLTDDRPTEHGG
jgi:AmiR/NasT family two-component response regulator